MCLDGITKIRPWSNGTITHVNGGDHLSTLSRPRSGEGLSNGNGTLPNNNRSCNGIISRGAGGLHEDTEFPPSLKSLSRRKPIIWMRPHVRVK